MFQDTFDSEFLNISEISFPLPFEVSSIIMSFLLMKDLAHFGAVCKWSRHLITNTCYDDSALANFDDWNNHDMLTSN
jgi:hypothetical protein